MDQPPVPAPPPTPPQKPKRGPLVWILVGCFGLLILGGAGIGGIVYLVYSMTKPPADATHAFFDKINAGDLDTAYANASAGFRASVTPEDFRSMFKGMRVSDVTLSQRNIQNNVATMSGTVTVEGEGSMSLTVELVQNGEAWEVEAISGAFGSYAAGRITPAD